LVPQLEKKWIAMTPRLEIEYCAQCRWLLRAAWMAQELLTADAPVHDPETRDRRLRECVHDYFFVKSLSLLKPGGVQNFERRQRA
jgi:hypothetical protein